MQYSEIPIRSRIVISVTNGSDMQARFMSKVMRNQNNSLFVIPFRHKNKRINFQGRNVKIHMEVRDLSGVLWTFKNCKISTVKKNGLTYHKINTSTLEGIENRRGGRRFYIWDKAVFYVDGVENPIFSNIRDVGPIGFSFVIDRNKKIEGLKEGVAVRAVMKDQTGEEVAAEGMIVRKEMLEKYVIYGCKMDAPSEKLTNYINYLEKKNIVVDAEV